MNNNINEDKEINIKNNEYKADFKVYFTLLIKFSSWFMVAISILTLIMEILSSYRIYKSDLFSRPKTMVAVLFVTFAVWFIRSFVEAFIYPSYKLYMFMFLLLTVTSGYLLTTQII